MNRFMVHAGREVASGDTEDCTGRILRLETADDAGFLAELFALGARELYGEAAAALEPMIAMQHRAQVQSYASAYPGALGEIILDADGRPAGRLLTNMGEDDILIVDIAVSPPCRNRGLARAALDQVQMRARQARLRVTAQVIVTNAASLALFSGLGFAASYKEGEAQVLVDWTP